MRISEKKGKITVKGFNILEDRCIWMKGGVVSFRLCDRAYDCYNCPFDKGMQRAMKSSSMDAGKEDCPWVKNLGNEFNELPRPCRHLLTGRIDAPKICTQNYQCASCAFDQYLDEMEPVQALSTPVFKSASGYMLADDYYYHMGHSWLRFEHGGRIRVGVDDFMVKLFGKFDSILLPPMGAKLSQGIPALKFFRGEKRAAVLSPMTGTVIRVNQNAVDHTRKIHEDPYDSGWLFTMEPDSLVKDLRILYFGNESLQWVEQERMNLLGLMGKEYERLAATGGAPVDDFFGHYPDAGWGNLVSKFLHIKEAQDR